MRRAVFPGSFDPITLGHYDIIKRSLPLFDEIIVAIGVNADKKYMFPLEERQRFIEQAFADEPSVKVVTYSGLTIDFCKEVKAKFILRGLRNPADFEFEKAIAHTNRKLSKIETVFLLTAANTSYISSSIVRDVIRNGGDFS
ncbi:MAG TPA: pantetheine-phosphate adenylyltransferase, partial [Flavobacterium sp.]|nr:pantetheine-phosphate adenylyltransferase [Flavobacterium sp.]